MEQLFGHEVWSDPDSGGTTKFRPTSAAWPYPNYDFYYPDTSLPLDQCIENYRDVGPFHYVASMGEFHCVVLKFLAEYSL